MSQTYSIVCRETKQKVWIGQGWGEMTSLYSGEQDTMERLRKFLNETKSKTLEFVCDDEGDADELTEYGETPDEKSTPQHCTVMSCAMNDTRGGNMSRELCGRCLNGL